MTIALTRRLNDLTLTFTPTSLTLSRTNLSWSETVWLTRVMFEFDIHANTDFRMQLSFRCTHKMNDALKERADQFHMSRNSYIRCVFDCWLDLPEPPSPPESSLPTRYERTRQHLKARQKTLGVLRQRHNPEYKRYLAAQTGTPNQRIGRALQQLAAAHKDEYETVRKEHLTEIGWVPWQQLYDDLTLASQLVVNVPTGMIEQLQGLSGTRRGALSAYCCWVLAQHLAGE